MAAVDNSSLWQKQKAICRRNRFTNSNSVTTSSAAVHKKLKYPCRAKKEFIFQVFGDHKYYFRRRKLILLHSLIIFMVRRARVINQTANPEGFRKDELMDHITIAIQNRTIDNKRFFMQNI